MAGEDPATCRNGQDWCKKDRMPKAEGSGQMSKTHTHTHTHAHANLLTDWGSQGFDAQGGATLAEHDLLQANGPLAMQGALPAPMYTLPAELTQPAQGTHQMGDTHTQTESPTAASTRQNPPVAELHAANTKEQVDYKDDYAMENAEGAGAH
ncbi:hypothetical protein FS749_001509 [Ceratobasidium sp. UAMH 11750]|nr:hypothetical protein FS749_001509 [Ceratobasidium sp. UAMH 11750]